MSDQTECIGISKCGGPCDDSCPAARQNKGSAEQQTSEAPLQQPNAEILSIVNQALEHVINYNRESAIETLNKLTAKLSAA